jgi:hypothetical protein
LWGFLLMPSTPSFCFFLGGELGDEIGNLIAAQCEQDL